MSQLWNLAEVSRPDGDPPVLNLPLSPSSFQKCRCVVAAMPFGVAVCIARLIEVDTDTGKMHDSALDRDHKGGRGKLPPAFEPLRVSPDRSEEHTSELQSLLRTSYAVFCLKKKNK